MPSPSVRTRRFQFCWYSWRGPWLRFLWKQRFEGGLRHIYDWRIGIGPLDIRQWCERWRNTDV